jgi:hypothetical protein
LTALTSAEKQAGRAFREARQAALDLLNEASPPDEYVLPFWRVVRHECPAEHGASIGITLHGCYELSPEYRVCYCGRIGPFGPYFPHWDCDGNKVLSAAGRFAWIWKKGKCSGCGLVVRTRKGRVVLAADRAADHGRASSERRQAGPHSGDPRVSRA